jgi:hypothetical protein
VAIISLGRGAVAAGPAIVLTAWALWIAGLAVEPRESLPARAMR